MTKGNTMTSRQQALGIAISCFAVGVLLLLVMILLAGCASSQPAPPPLPAGTPTPQNHLTMLVVAPPPILTTNILKGWCDPSNEVPGLVCVFDCRTNLQSTNWTTLRTLSYPTAGGWIFATNIIPSGLLCQWRSYWRYSKTQ